MVFRHEIRIKIVSELYQREMSPKQFFDEFGGGTLSRVDRHFKALTETGWLRYVRQEGPDSRRRGAREHFYRANALAIIDNDTWALVPYSLRVATSWRTFRTLAERVREALDAGTLDARDESHLSFTTMNLDQLGWDRIIAVVDSYFETIFKELADSRERIAKSGETPMVATLALAAFESPTRLASEVSQTAGHHPNTPPPLRTTPELVSPEEDSPYPFSTRVSKVFADEIALKILTEANIREISVPLMHAEVGGDTLEGIRRRVKGLAKNGWLRRVKQETGGKRRAGVESFYRATAPAIFDNESWAAMPEQSRPTFSWSIFRLLADLVREAIEAGTFEARLDNHLSWTVFRFDQEGWENVTRALDHVLAFILAEKDRAEDRLDDTGEAPITTTVGLMAFESPRSAVKEP